MDASERITYKSLNASVNEDGEMAFDMDPVQMKQSKENADCEDLDFETAYEETPFDEEEFRWTPRLIYDYIGEYVHGQYGGQTGCCYFGVQSPPGPPPQHDSGRSHRLWQNRNLAFSQ